MSFLKTPFRLGDLVLPNNVFYAPLAGCSDYPFRRMGNRYRPGLFFCEMVKIEAVIRHDPDTYRLLDFDGEMHPIGAQLCGSNPKIAADAAKIVEDLGFDTLDFNCGCPVDKVTKDGSGSGMLKTPEKIGEVISSIRKAVKIPVTVKIRAGWDENSLEGPRIVKIAEEAGAAALCIHGRTREQGYKGPAVWEHIRACKEAARSMLIFGNGDLFQPEDAPRMFQETGCDGILVARGTMGQPWIVEDMLRVLQGEEPKPRTVDTVREALFAHLHEILSYRSERQALLDFRRVGCWYLKRCEGVRALRQELNRATSTAQVFSILESFRWDEAALASVAEEC